MRKAWQFLKSSYEELTQKVSWPSYESLQQSTLVIIVATLIISSVVWFMDSGSGLVFRALYSVFS